MLQGLTPFENEVLDFSIDGNIFLVEGYDLVAERILFNMVGAEVCEKKIAYMLGLETILKSQNPSEITLSVAQMSVFPWRTEFSSPLAVGSARMVLQGDEVNAYRRGKIVQNEMLPEEIMEYLAGSGIRVDRLTLAKNPYLTDKVALMLIKRGDYDVRLNLMQRLDLKQKSQWHRALCIHGDENARCIVAQNSSDTEILNLLSKDDSYYVLLEVVENADCPSEALRNIFNNKASLDLKDIARDQLENSFHDEVGPI